MAQLNKSLLSSVLLCLLFFFFVSLQVRATLAVVPDVGDADFEATVLQSEEPVLVFFWADWCGGCRVLSPVIEEMAHQYDGRLNVYKLNVDENQEIPTRYHIRSMPTLILFKDGQVQGKLAGIVSASSIIKMINSILNENGISIDTSM